MEYKGGLGSGGLNGENKGQYNLLGLLLIMTIMAGAMITSNCLAIRKKPLGSVPRLFGDNQGWDDNNEEEGRGSLLSEEAEMSDDDEVESGADNSEVEEG